MAQQKISFEESIPVVEAKSKKELFQEYQKNNKVSYSTFLKWIQKLHFYQEIKACHVLQPKYVSMIYQHLGNP